MIRLRSFRGCASEKDRNETKCSNNRPHGRVSTIANFLSNPDRAKHAVARFSTIRKSKGNPAEHVGDAQLHHLSHEQSYLKKGAESAPTQAKTNNVKKWMRRVLPKDKDGKPGIFPRITKKSKSTNNNGIPPSTTNACGKTVTDESSSKFSLSRNDDSPREMMLAGALSSFGNILRSIETNQDAISNSRTRTVDRRERESLFFEDDYEDDVFGNIDDEISHDIATENVEEITFETSHSQCKDDRLDPNRADKGTGVVFEDVSREVPLEKSEILSQLFPLGYPNDPQTEVETDQVVKEDSCIVEEDAECKEMSKKPFHRAEVIRSLFPFGHPDERKKKGLKEKSNFIEQCLEQKENITSHIQNRKIALLHEAKAALLQGTTSRATKEKPLVETIELFNEDPDPTGAESSGQGECDKFIGLVITFDPTWDLLVPEELDSTIGAPRARLKKFHEIENYADSLLGKFAAEECSEESTDLMAGLNLTFDTDPSLAGDSVSSETSSGSFKLGFHFDEERFPMVDPSFEVEICFHCDDEVSIEFTTEEIVNLPFKIIGTGKTNSKSEEKTEVHHHPGKGTEIIFHAMESNDDLHIDKIVSNDNCSTTVYEEFSDCVEYEQNIHDPLPSPVQSPIQIFESTPENYFLSPVSIPQQPFVVDSLLMPRNESEDHFEGASSLKIEAGIRTQKSQRRAAINLRMPPHFGAVLSPASSTPSFHSTKSRDPSATQEEGNEFYDAVMADSPDQQLHHRNTSAACNFKSSSAICNAAL